MTALELQHDLAEEVKKILRHMVFKNPDGKQAEIETFTQFLPKQWQEIDYDTEEEGSDPYPYCVIQLDSGKLESGQSTQEIRTVLVFGIFDDNLDCQGYQDIVNIIHKIMERFTKNPVLNNFRLNEKAGINWILEETDRYPFFHGGLVLTWDTAFVRREDNYA